MNLHYKVLLLNYSISILFFIYHLNTAGTTKVELKKLVPGSVSWAQLETAETSTIGSFIDTLEDQASRPTEHQRYLFDLSLPIHCPKLSQEVTTPKYFTGLCFLSIH